MRVSVKAESGEILQSLSPTPDRDRVVADIAPKDLSYLDVDKMRGVERVRRREETLIDANSSGRLKEPLDRGRRIEDNHRASRSRRTASAVGRVASI
jgi:hypothetical protein